MNQDRFDELSRALATSEVSRLQVLKALGASVVGTLLGGSLIGTQPRSAAAQDEAQQTPTTTSPCYYYPECSPGCSDAPSGYTPTLNTCYTEGGYVGNCWYGEAPRSDGCTDIWVCCDYLVNGTTDPCLCSTYITTQC